MDVQCRHRHQHLSSDAEAFISASGFRYRDTFCELFLGPVLSIKRAQEMINTRNTTTNQWECNQKTSFAIELPLLLGYGFTGNAHDIVSPQASSKAMQVSRCHFIANASRLGSCLFTASSLVLSLSVLVIRALALQRAHLAPRLPRLTNLPTMPNQVDVHGVLQVGWYEPLQDLVCFLPIHLWIARRPGLGEPT